MIVFGNQKIEDWVATRILNFLNYTRAASKIVETIQDDPNSGAPGEGASIGETVAARILAKRNSLPNRRFSSISELEGIQGFGEDKMRDMIYTLGVRAADAFRDGLYEKNILLENWNLEHHTYYFPDEEEFNFTANITPNFTNFVAHQVNQLVSERKNNELAGYLAERLIFESYQDAYDISHIASFAFALWFYHFDQDNWFSFERMRLEIERYLGHYIRPHDDLRFVLFKGFPNGATLVKGITTPDLPVVINRPERAISIWTSELFD
jgi:hypothetical protein